MSAEECASMKPKRRKLRVLVITMGGPREEAVKKMFAECSQHFEPPSFCPGVPARGLRTRQFFFQIAHQAGLIPAAEWEALQLASQNPQFQKRPDLFFECLKDVPVTTSRHGSQAHQELHYSVELWRKSKALNRGRNVLGCLLAHLIAMKKLVEENYDIILEDNIRMPLEMAADRIWDTIDASEKSKGAKCHLRYYGWLGSLPNLKWVLNIHSNRKSVTGSGSDHSPKNGCKNAKIFYFPIVSDFDNNEENADTDDAEEDDTQELIRDSSEEGHTTPGGTAIWGAYAYWISEEGYNSLLKKLRCDVGAILWKGKKMRQYLVKPIDKIIPRQVTAAFSRENIHVTNNPAFFRAPMLTSKIHSKWDPKFCSSTQYQLGTTSLSWSDLWLTEIERRIVEHHIETGEWVTVGQITGSQHIIVDHFDN